MIITLMALAAAEPLVVATLEEPEFARMGIVAEMLERPAGITDEQFAQQLIDAEGLRPWNGKQLNSAPTPGAMGSMAVFAGDGRQIIVKYVSGDLQQTGRVCRVRFALGGMSDARWNAYRWCASALGLQLPDKPPPPIIMERRQR